METEVAKTKATENKHERDFFYFFCLLNLSFLFVVTHLQQKQLWRDPVAERLSRYWKISLQLIDEILAFIFPTFWVNAVNKKLQYLKRMCLPG